MRDTYTPPDINPPADGDEPEPMDDNDCTVCGHPLDEEDHDEHCIGRGMTDDEYADQVKRDWRRYVGRESVRRRG